MCTYKVLKANAVNEGHTCYLGVFGCAELKNVVCPAQKWTEVAQIEQSKMAASHKQKYSNDISFGCSKIQTKV